MPCFTFEPMFFEWIESERLVLNPLVSERLKNDIQSVSLCSCEPTFNGINQPKMNRNHQPSYVCNRRRRVQVPIRFVSCYPVKRRLKLTSRHTRDIVFQTFRMLRNLKLNEESFRSVVLVVFESEPGLDTKRFIQRSPRSCFYHEL